MVYEMKVGDVMTKDVITINAKDSMSLLRDILRHNSISGLPVLDGDGYPIQTRGVTGYPGLYFVGLPWLHTGKSGLLYGVGADAAHIVADITASDGQ